MLHWSIIGGGIHGCTLAAYLLRQKKTGIHHLGVIDPHDKPLQKWIQNTATIQMPYLRSPSIHHLDVEPFALEKFAKKNEAGLPLPLLYPMTDLP